MPLINSAARETQAGTVHQSCFQVGTLGLGVAGELRVKAERDDSRALERDRARVGLEAHLLRRELEEAADLAVTIREPENVAGARLVADVGRERLECVSLGWGRKYNAEEALERDRGDNVTQAARHDF